MKQIFSYGLLLVLTCLFTGCDQLRSVTSPSGFSNSGSYRNVWLTPNIASRDMLDMFRKSEEWAEVRKSISVFKFYEAQAGSCPVSICGENNFPNFMSVIPGGAFQWLNREGIDIGLESGSVKPFNCGRLPDDSVYASLDAINNIESNGGRVSYIAMDEPFMSGLPAQYSFADSFGSCGYSVDKTAEYVAYYINRVQSANPGVSIGLIEPYPYFSIKQIESFIEALEARGIRIPFFHLDFDPAYTIDYETDIRSLQNFLRNKSISFGVIIIGADGSSSGAAMGGEMAMTLRINNAIGVSSQNHILVQSWLESNKNGDKLYPDNLPENDPRTMTGFTKNLLQMVH